LRKVLHILVGVVGHLLQWANKLVGKHVLVNVLLVVVYYFRHTEFDVWNIILRSLQEDWDDVLGDRVLWSVWHHRSQRVQAAHPVVVALLVNGVVVVHHWNVLLKNPVLGEGVGQDGTLLNTHLSHTGSSVGQVAHEGGLEVLLEKVLSEDDSKVSDELEHSHSNSPLSILGHVAEGAHELSGEEVSANDVSDLDKSTYHIQLDLRVVVLKELHKDWQHLLGGVLLTNDLGHLAESLGGSSLELSGGVSVGVLEGWQHEVANLLSGEVDQALRDVQDGGMLHLSLVVVQQQGEGLDEVVVRDLLSERVGEGSEVLGESQSDLPGLVLTSGKKSAKGMDLVLLLGKILGHWNERLEAHHSNGILLILRQLSEDWQDLLKNVLLLKLGSELTKFGGASSSNHGSVLVAELDELLSQLLLLWSRLGVAWEEELAGADSSSEPLALGKLDHERSEDILDLSVAKIFRNSR
jgi:hypothetical protein